MGLATAERDNNLGRFRGTAAGAMANPLYIALLTTSPTDEAGTGLVEVSTADWSNYARVAIASTTAGWSAPAAGTGSARKITNAAKTDFGTATVGGTAPVVISFAVFDAATAGSFKGWGTVPSQTINNGDPVYFNAGALELDQ